MDTVAAEPIKPRVLELVATGQARQQAFVDGLSEDERARIGEPDNWAPKDQITHIVGWIHDAARVIAAAARGETPDPSSADDVYNPRRFAEMQHASWDEVLADSVQAYAALNAAIAECSEEDLSDPARFPWRNGYPLWAEAHVNANEHPAEHYGQVYLEADDYARAAAVRQEAVDTSRKLIGGTLPFGYMLYNLSCFYAQNGPRDLAFAALREALPLAPRLYQWSQEDTDIASLRDDPKFQELLAANSPAGLGPTAD